MIVYGYAIDMGEVSWDVIEELENDLYDKGIDLCVMSCYSVGGHDLPMIVVGVTLDGADFIFNPVPLDDLNMTPTDKEIEDVTSFEMPNELVDHVINDEPKVMIFVTSND